MIRAPVCPGAFRAAWLGPVSCCSSAGSHACCATWPAVVKPCQHINLNSPAITAGAPHSNTHSEHLCSWNKYEDNLVKWSRAVSSHRGVQSRQFKLEWKAACCSCRDACWEFITGIFAWLRSECVRWEITLSQLFHFVAKSHVNRRESGDVDHYTQTNRNKELWQGEREASEGPQGSSEADLILVKIYWFMFFQETVDVFLNFSAAIRTEWWGSAPRALQVRGNTWAQPQRRGSFLSEIRSDAPYYSRCVVVRASVRRTEIMTLLQLRFKHLRTSVTSITLQTLGMSSP